MLYRLHIPKLTCPGAVGEIFATRTKPQSPERPCFQYFFSTQPQSVAFAQYQVVYSPKTRSGVLNARPSWLVQHPSVHLLKKRNPMPACTCRYAIGGG